VRTVLADGRHDESWAKLAGAVVLLLKGTASLYNGEEIGMENLIVEDPDLLLDPIGPWLYQASVAELGMPHEEAARLAARHSRDRCRSPMQWTGGDNGGFSPPGTDTWLPVHPNHRAGVNVADQRRDPASILSLYRDLIHLRRSHTALSLGDYAEIEAGDDQVLAFRRTHPEEACQVAMNMGPGRRSIALAPATPLFSSVRDLGDVEAGDRVVLEPFEVVLRREA
jgi:glycosidase